MYHSVRSLLLFSFVLSVVQLAGMAVANACPFCTSVSQTFTEEINAMDAVVITRLVSAPALDDASQSDPNAPLPKAIFEVVEILKGDAWVKPGEKIEVIYFGNSDTTKRFLVMGTDPPQVVWSTPLSLSDRAYAYVKRLPELPADDTRLEFFQEHLQDEDEMLARDAYDEFAKAPYAAVINLKDKMHHDQLVEWIKDLEVPASHRRLYFTMLGVCGKPEDAQMIEQFMTSADRKQKAGLDAMIACYLLLKPQEGLEVVEEQFLKNPDSEYADTYAAIMAIRFHGTETKVIDRKRLTESLRVMLDRPELADLVIPDLAKWEDWEVMPRLVELFKNADEKSSWVRVPVVNFLRSCPLPEAKKYIEELAAIDPEAVKRAQTFFPFDPAGEQQAKETADENDQSSNLIQPTPLKLEDEMATPIPVPEELLVAVEDSPTTTVSATEPLEMVARVEDPALAAAADEPPALSTESVGPTAVATPLPERGGGLQSAGQKRSLRRQPTWQPNLAQRLCVPLLAGCGIFAALHFVLGVPLKQSGSKA